MFEASCITERWVKSNLRHHRVILPTESSRQAWLRSGFPESRIRLCPLGVDPELYSRKHRPLPLELADGSRVADYTVRFLNISELNPRKNLLGLIRAWIRATSNKDDAVLIVKLLCTVPGQREWFMVQLYLLERQLEKRLSEAAPIHFVYDLLPDVEMPRVYAAATHYISLSFGEGWDLPMVEAGASGLALIAPKHSAYTAYLDDTVADFIPAREVPAVYSGDRETAALFDGASWWKPDEDAAVAVIRSVIGKEGSGKSSPRQRFLQELTWEKATARLIEILDEAGA
jgi:glycosyltransferase involved in cell wall biosynthesis